MGVLKYDNWLRNYCSGLIQLSTEDMVHGGAMDRWCVVRTGVAIFIGVIFFFLLPFF